MQWRNAAILGALGLALCGARTSSEALLKLGLTEEELVNVVGQTPTASVPIYALSPLKAVPPAQRVKAVKTLVGWAKSYLQSPEFKVRYRDAWTARGPTPPVPPRTAEQMRKELDAQFQQSIQDMRASLSRLPGPQQADMERLIKLNTAEHRKSMEEFAARVPALAAAEKARFEAEKRAYDAQMAELEETLPKDPRVWTCRSLERFVLDTHGVKHDARLIREGSWASFRDDALEEKPTIWKACFRAGQPACDAARSEATSWMRELGCLH